MNLKDQIIKGNGTIRRIDFRGRIVMPKEAREYLGIAKGDPVEVFLGKDCVTIKCMPQQPQ